MDTANVYGQISVLNEDRLYHGSWNCYQDWRNFYFYGVISSEQNEFDGDRTPDRGTITGCYGIDDHRNQIYLGGRCVWSHSTREIDENWTKPLLPNNEVFLLNMTADWSETRCKLSIFYQGKKLNESNDQYTILLPKLDQEFVWYPCVALAHENSHCTIQYSQ